MVNYRKTCIDLPLQCCENDSPILFTCSVPLLSKGPAQIKRLFLSAMLHRIIHYFKELDIIKKLQSSTTITNKRQPFRSPYFNKQQPHSTSFSFTFLRLRFHPRRAPMLRNERESLRHRTQKHLRNLDPVFRSPASQ